MGSHSQSFWRKAVGLEFSGLEGLPSGLALLS